MWRKLPFSILISICIILTLLIVLLSNYTKYGIKKGFPNFKGIFLNGDSFELKDYKGKKLILLFFDTTRKSSLSQLIILHRIHSDFGDQNVIFIPISFEEKSTIKSWLQEKQLNINVLLMKKKDIERRIKIGLTPFLLFLNKKGRVCFLKLGRASESFLRRSITTFLINETIPPQEILKPGMKAPFFILKDIYGKEYNSIILAKEGALLIFGKLMHQSCQKQFSFLGYLVKEENAPLYFITLDKKDAVKEFLGNKDLDFPVLVAEDFQLYEEYSVFVIPTFFILDNQHMIKFIYRGEMSDEQLLHLLKEYNLLSKKIKIGSKAKDFQLYDLGDNLFSLKENQSKKTILSFININCDTCRKVIPILQEFYFRNESSNISIYLIISENKVIVDRFIKTNNISIPVLTDHLGTVNYEYVVEEHPTTYFINEHLVIVGISRGNDPEFFNRILSFYQTIN